MDHSELMDGLDPSGNRLDQPRRLARIPRRAVELGGEAAPADEFHLEKRPPLVVADRVNADDIGMLEPGDGLGLDFEPGQQLGRGIPAWQQHFQRHDPIQADVAGAENHPHAAMTQLAFDLISRDHGLRHALARRPRRDGLVDRADGMMQRSGGLSIIRRRKSETPGSVFSTVCTKLRWLSRVSSSRVRWHEMQLATCPSTGLDSLAGRSSSSIIRSCSVAGQGSLTVAPALPGTAEHPRAACAGPCSWP